MAKPPAGLVTRSAPAGVAVVGLALLDEARDACGRLDEPEDEEALHDFRVALRRLRTLLRSFKNELSGIVPKKQQRRLRNLARRTTAARDAEVQLDWIRAHRAELGSRVRAGLPWLVARLDERRTQAYATIRGEVAAEFRQLERRLRRALGAALVDADPKEPAFATSAARLIREYAAGLEQELAAARSARADQAIHAARIAAKRLRYVLEPLAGDVPQLTGSIEQLKRLQDLLGELHDVAVLIAELEDAGAEAAAERARGLHARALRGEMRPAGGQPKRPRPASAGLLALARRAADWQERLFSRLGTEWRERALPALLQEVGGAAQSLATKGAPPALRLPPPPRRQAARRVRQRKHAAPVAEPGA